MVENGECESTKRKEYYDKKVVDRKVEVGMQVLLRKPGLIRKLDTTWMGPYKVIRKV